MRTVSDLITELQKFPPDAVCYAYEGEVCGVVVEEKEKPTDPDGRFLPRRQGVVHCSEYVGLGDDRETEVY